MDASRFNRSISLLKPIRKVWVTALVSVAFVSVAQALPVTTFTTNASGGFDAVYFPNTH
jgi:hypothetical protein